MRSAILFVGGGAGVVAVLVRTFGGERGGTITRPGGDPMDAVIFNLIPVWRAVRSRWQSSLCHHLSRPLEVAAPCRTGRRRHLVEQAEGNDLDRPYLCTRVLRSAAKPPDPSDHLKTGVCRSCFADHRPRRSHAVDVTVCLRRSGLRAGCQRCAHAATGSAPDGAGVTGRSVIPASLPV